MSGARDPRTGLQRRYTMAEILELHGGKAKIQPLTYDALAMLRNPLYVKFAEELDDRISEMNRDILTKQTEDAAVRQMASDNNLPHDQLKEVVQRAPVQDDPYKLYGDGACKGDGGDDVDGGGCGGWSGSSGSVAVRVSQPQQLKH